MSGSIQVMTMNLKIWNFPCLAKKWKERTALTD